MMMTVEIDMGYALTQVLQLIGIAYCLHYYNKRAGLFMDFCYRNKLIPKSRWEPAACAFWVALIAFPTIVIWLYAWKYNIAVVHTAWIVIAILYIVVRLITGYWKRFMKQNNGHSRYADKGKDK